jgi:hypothetical protein
MQQRPAVFDRDRRCNSLRSSDPSSGLFDQEDDIKSGSHLANELEWPTMLGSPFKVTSSSHRYTRRFGKEESELASPQFGKFKISGIFKIRSTRSRRDAQFILKLGFQAFGLHILQLEFKLRQFAKAWLGSPTFQFQLSIVNFREPTSPIFIACQENNLTEVRQLLESRQANINDVAEVMEVYGTSWNKEIKSERWSLLQVHFSFHSLSCVSNFANIS